MRLDRGLEHRTLADVHVGVRDQVGLQMVAAGQAEPASTPHHHVLDRVRARRICLTNAVGGGRHRHPPQTREGGAVAQLELAVGGSRAAQVAAAPGRYAAVGIDEPVHPAAIGEPHHAAPGERAKPYLAAQHRIAHDQ